MSKTPEEKISPETRRAIRRAFLTLLAMGLLIGSLTALGVVTLMHRFNLIGVPEQQQP
jgi:uncharacterized membrane protein